MLKSHASNSSGTCRLFSKYHHGSLPSGILYSRPPQLLSHSQEHTERLLESSPTIFIQLAFPTFDHPHTIQFSVQVSGFQGVTFPQKPSLSTECIPTVIHFSFDLSLTRASCFICCWFFFCFFLKLCIHLCNLQATGLI